ncbi:MAG TPA: putative Ig domain-containing protein [Nitrospira sp.]|nr:putative Ig domain-containing protein [Nitrospira sp.]
MDESPRLSESNRLYRSARDHGSCALPSLSAALAMFLLAGCLGDNGTASRTSENGNHPPIIKGLSILPNPATLAGPLTVRVEAQDADSDTVLFRYRWFVNGQVIAGQTRESLPPTFLKRGDQLTVEVTPFDGKTDGVSQVSAPVAIGNTAPILSSLSVDFDHEAQGRHLLARVEVLDPDEDRVSLHYRWRKNETVVKEGQDNTLSVVGLTPTDVIDVDVTASDGNADGKETVSGRFTLSNSSPTIVSTPSVSATGGAYDYQVKATDPDGDPITYKLEDAPPGMSIEEQTGHIQWNVAPDAHGTYHIKVVAQDNKGGFAAQDFELSVSAPAKAS